MKKVLLAFLVVILALSAMGEFLFYQRVDAAAGFVQANGNGGSGTSLTSSVNSTNAGNLIVVCVQTSSNAVSSVSDNKSNNYIRAAQLIYSGNEVSLYYAYNSTGGVTSVTANAASWDGGIAMIVSEYSGVLTSANPLDQTSNFDNGYNGGDNWTSGNTSATTQAEELIVGCTRERYQDSTFSAGANFSARRTQNSRLFLEDRNVTSTGAYAATGSRGGASGYNIDALVATFKVSGGTTPPPSDTTAPSVPTNLSATVVSTSQINLSWSASSDAVGVSGYRVYRNGTQINTTSNTSYSDTGLSASTSYTYTVAAYDAAGNVSSQSSSVSGTTQAGTTSDTTAPSVPANLSATAISSSQINLSWSASTDAVGVTGYRIYRGGVQVSTSLVTNYSDPALSASTAYTYTVAAYDAAGNVSAQSSSVSATTQAGTVTPPSTGSGSLVLFYSDLDWGPKTGWEGSSSKGAAVTVWGKNFGSSRGSNYITVNGAQLTQSSDYAEWGVVGPARGLERITFWVPSSATDGDGSISVTVGGVTSNTLPFKVMSGTIYFISPSGSNSNNGLYSTSAGGSNGPFKDLWKFNPCGSTDSNHTVGSCNPSQDGQYITYVRAGTYTTLDIDSTFVALRGPYGGPTKRKALIGYPAENPIINTASASRGIVWAASYDPYGFNDYFTFAKLTGMNGTAPMGAFGSYTRIIGNTFKDYLTYAQAGVVQVTDSKYTSIYGNLFQNNGNDSMKHNVYIKTEPTGLNTSSNNLSTLYTYVGWNEFADAVSSDTHGGVIFISKEGSASVAPFPTDHVYIHDNYFHDGNMDFIYSGDSVTLGENIYIYNNIFKGGTSSNGGITIYDGTTNIYFYNNTFYQIGATSLPMAWQTGNSHSFWKNNIWYMGSGQTAFSLETYKGATFNSDHDLFYNGSVPSGSGLTVTNVLTSNPLLTAPVSGNLELQSGSPAINVGTSAVNTIVSKDYSGISRPQGASYDLGAYEYMSGSTAPSPTGDTTAPSVPTNLSATVVSTSQINLSWSASSDAVGVSGYRVYRNGTQINTTSNTSYSDTGLSASTSYTYTVAAYDAAGNVSSQSSSVSGTTQSQVVLPVISNLTGSNTTATTTRISWETNVATNGQVFYGLTSAYGQQSTVVDGSPRTTSHTVTLSNLTSSTFYHFQVRSIDASNNTVTSSDFTFTTLAAPLPPSPVISSFTASPTSITSGQSSTLTWSVSNATSLSINQGVGIVTGSSRMVSPTVTTTYTLTATGAGGTATAQVTVTVGGIASTSTPPVITSFTASNESIVAGDSTALSWTITGNPTPTVTISGGVGTPVGSLVSVSPTVTTTYILTATNSAGSATGQVTVSVTPFNDGSGGGSPGGGGSGGTISTSTPGTIVFIPPMSTPGIKEIISAIIRLINIDGTYYLVKNNRRLGITNPGMLSSYGLTFLMAKIATAGDLALLEGPLLTPGDGSLVKSAEDPTIYLISGQKRYAFTSAKVFLSLGHKWSSVLTVTNPELQALLKGENLYNEQAAHLPGTDIVVNGTIYWVGEDNMLHGYPSLEVYNSWHIPNDFTKVVKANAADQLKPIGELVAIRVLE